MDFGSGCRTGTDDSNLIRAAVGVRQEEDTLPRGTANGDGATLVQRKLFSPQRSLSNVEELQLS
jgi:hypothetical protein